MSRKIKYKVELIPEERTQLETMLSKGRHSVRELKRANILLSRDVSEQRIAKKQSEISVEFNVAQPTVYQICQRYCEGGLERALYDRPRSGRPVALSEHQQAQFTALACSNAPEGHDHWTHSLLADRFVQLENACSISSSTAGRLLKKTKSNPGKTASGASEN